MSSTATRQLRGGPPSEPTPADMLAARSGLRMRPMRPVRALFGALLMVTAIVAALAIYARLGDRTSVLALNRIVLAGERITAADLRVVGVSSDDPIAWVASDERAAVVGQYARYRLADGALLVRDAVQPRPLVTQGKVLVGVSVPAANVPVGLREQSAVVLVIIPPGHSLEPPQLVSATVVAVPPRLVELTGGAASPSAMVTLSVEIDPVDIVRVAAADGIGLALVDPLDAGVGVYLEAATAERTDDGSAAGAPLAGDLTDGRLAGGDAAGGDTAGGDVANEFAGDEAGHDAGDGA